MLFGVVAAGLGAGRAFAQTPSPLQEWQYSRGAVLENLYQGSPPDWQAVVGAATERAPLYDGSSRYRTRGGPVLELMYKDLAFASVGDGIGINLLRARNYVGGIAVTYDLGRRVEDDTVHLRGLDNLGRAPVVKLFYSYVLSESFPLVLRADVREIIGGEGGVMADAGGYLPLPGSSANFMMFAGTTVTWADHTHEARVFGVSTEESELSAYPQFSAHAGLQSAGVGFSATRRFGRHWMVNFDAAYSRLRSSARESPITQERNQHVYTLSAAYQW